MPKKPDKLRDGTSELYEKYLDEMTLEALKLGNSPDLWNFKNPIYKGDK